MTQYLNANYEGATIQLVYTESGSAELLINGIRRDSASTGGKLMTLKLGSPVQTGYEHHEFMEAHVEFNEDSVIARLHTGGDTLAEQESHRVSPNPEA